jgi:chromosome partitioning protein
MALVISVLQQKGGVGKTTLATSLFAHLVSERASVGIVDLDPQGNSTSWAIGANGFQSIRQHCGAEAFTLPYGAIARRASAGSGPRAVVDSAGSVEHDERDEHVLPCVKLGGGFLVPANQYMAVHTFTDFRPDLLPFDVAIVDTPPHLATAFFRVVVSQSHAVVAPVQPEPHAVQNVPDLMRQMEVGGQHLLDNNTLRLVVTMRQKCTNHEAHEKYLRKHWGRYVSPVVVPRGTAWSEAGAFGIPWKPKSAVAKTAKALWGDLEKTMLKAKGAA